MKKVLLSLISLIFITPVFAAQQVEDLFKDLQNMEATYFNSAMVPDIEVKEEKSNVKNLGLYKRKISPIKDYTVIEPEERYVDHMPFFKQTRLRIQNLLREQEIKSDAKALEREKIRIKKEEEKALMNSDSDLNIKNVKYVDEVDKTKKFDEVTNNVSEQSELLGAIHQQVTTNEMVLDCDNLQYDDLTGDISAIGSPKLIFPNQSTTLTADLIIYNNASNILKAIGNVVIMKDGMPITGDYITVNMNEENIFMENVKMLTPKMRIIAKNAESKDGKIFLNDGSFKSEDSGLIVLESHMIGPDFTKMFVDEKDRYNFISEDDLGKLKIDADFIKVDGSKAHDVFQFKDAEVFYNKKYLFTLPSLTAYTNKKHEYFEANYPEFGSRSGMGMFIGPGLVVPGPYGSIIKLIPLLNYNNKIGFGGAVKFRSAFNDTQFMYGSAQNFIYLKGSQKLDEYLSLQYGINAFMPDGFLGSRMPRYIAELVFEKPTTIKNFLGPNMDMTYHQRATFGYAKDGNWNKWRENLQSTDQATIRARYQAQIDQTLYRYENLEERKILDLALVLQGSAALYGTGDTQFVGRIGPRLHTQYKYWMQDIGYFQAAYSDHTPLPVFDTYRYGHSNVYIREALRLCKFVTIGWSTSVTLSGDAPNGEMFQENAFVLSLGPDDIKFNIAYDVYRKSTYCSLAVAIDSKNTNVDFDKMEIKNPERVGKETKQNDNVAFSQTKDTKPVKAKNKVYAEVIKIEDPDRETIQ